MAHEAETVLDQLRNGLRKVSPAVIDVLLKANDFLREEIAGLAGQLQGRESDAGEWERSGAGSAAGAE